MRSVYKGASASCQSQLAAASLAAGRAWRRTMNLELNEREARLMRAQLVRHIVELEDELSRSGPSAVGRTLAVEIRTLREIYARLTGMLDSEGHRSMFPPVAKVAP